MKKKYSVLFILLLFILCIACNPPVPPKKKGMAEKHNYIVLLDLSDRLIIQYDQPDRDKAIIKTIYEMFEQKARKELFIRSRDEIKVVIAPQKGSKLQREVFEEKLFVDMENIPKAERSKNAEARRNAFYHALDSLYEKAVFSEIPEDYDGADIWKYFYEDLNVDVSKDTLTKNFLFIITDGYPIVGKDQAKLQQVNQDFSNINIILLEASPREKDLELERLIELWTIWFKDMDINNYSFIKRMAISKIKEQIKEITGMADKKM